MSRGSDGSSTRNESKASSRILREVTHPALIPGIGVEATQRSFRTNWTVFAIAGVLVLGVVVWGFVSPATIRDVGQASLEWVMTNFGWLFSLLAVVTIIFMFILGYGRTGGIRLGADGEKPEFSTVSWIAMLFSAGMGIGLLFWGPAEPLGYFLDLPSDFGVESETRQAMMHALAQSFLHWGPFAWAFYALVGGAIAYVAYRRGRPPLISAIFRPIFKERTDGWLGSIIDVFAIIVTLFGTAVTLGMGTLQISRGVEYVTGLGPFGNGMLILIVTLLTAAFVVSAVSGIKRGIRALSNINMVIAGIIGVFVFVAGPTLFILNILPASISAFFGDLFTMLMRNPTQGPEAAQFVSDWTNYYWAWWISWTPFVGMFIAKISRGRSLREFVTVTIVVPSVVCIVWFAILGGATMFYESNGAGISDADSNEGVLFAVISQLPLHGVVAVVAMISIALFFVTSADSAAIVMGSMTQRGKPEPSTWVTLVWGVLLGAGALALLLAGGETALSGLQAIMVVTALPFAIILIGIMISWTMELRTDPHIMRMQFAKAAIAQGVRKGIEEHGDDFVFGTSEVVPAEGAGARIDTEDPALTEWYDQATGAIDLVPDAIPANSVDLGPENGPIDSTATVAVEPARSKEP